VNDILNKEVLFQRLHLIDYREALDYQLQLFNDIVDIKIENRNQILSSKRTTPNYLIFCQHPHVYTLGKSGKETNLLINQYALSQLQASFYLINRGGDITYHGPGQIVGYPIFDLDNFFTDIHKYLRLLEEAVILTLSDYGMDGGRIPGLTGVWIDYKSQNNARKICAIGVKTSRWVTMHGFAFNVNTDLSYFNYIVPCGITDKAVTSMEKELGTSQSMEKVESRLLFHLTNLFDLQLIYLTNTHTQT
jgi:lipoyl(octanoyl) transferase